MTQANKLLIIDDNAVNLDTLLATLGETYDMRVAIDGQTALDLLATDYIPDLILLDIMMPELNGYDVCRRLKQNEATRDIPIIFLTAMDSDEDETQGLELGAVDYITKPFTPAIVKRRIQTQLELKQNRDRLHHLVADKTRDLTEAYQDLKQMHQQMLQQEKMASIGQLAAGVAHEINNPAGFIGSNLGSLRKYLTKLESAQDLCGRALAAVADEEQREQLQRERKKLKLDFILEDCNDIIDESRDGIERIATIVRNLKSFSRAEDDQPQAVDLNQVIDSAINIAWNEIKYKAQLEKDCQELPLLTCRPQQLGQVFVNLLVNAAQAIPEQGRIRVSTGSKGKFAVIRISDSGSGIDPDHLDQLFKPFFTTKEAGKGTGLGLSICHDIIQQHNGLIEVDSSPGEGTCFTLQIPFSGDPNGAAASPVQQARP